MCEWSLKSTWIIIKNYVCISIPSAFKQKVTVSKSVHSSETTMYDITTSLYYENDITLYHFSKSTAVWGTGHLISAWFPRSIMAVDEDRFLIGGLSAIQMHITL